MVSKKVTSALVATLLLSHTVLAPLTAAAQEQDGVQQVQETQTQTTEDSSVTETLPTTSDSSESVSDESVPSSEETTQAETTQDESQTQTESSEPATVADDTATAEQNARAGFSLDDWDYTTKADGSYVLTRYKASAPGGAVEIPGQFNGKQVYIQPGGHAPNVTGWNTSAGLCFKDNTKITSISFKAINGTKVKVYNGNLTGLFNKVQLSSLDVSGLDVSNVKSMLGLFYGCTKLQSLQNVVGLSSWDVSQVTDMTYMFDGCSSLTDLSGLKSWKTGSLTNMYGMFWGCSSLTDLTSLSGWEVGNVTNMGDSFSGCRSLTDLSPISGWKTGSVTNMGSMFSQCTSLSDLSPISGWKTDSVTNMISMFYKCTSLSDLSPISGWKTGSVTNMSSMFSQCTSLSDLSPISQWNISNVTTMRMMFNNCYSLTDLNPIKDWQFPKLKDMYGMFDGCRSLSDLSPISGWNTGSVTNMSSTFSRCTSLSDLSPLSQWNVSNVTTMRSMFYYCRKLTNLGSLSQWNVSNVTTMESMFYCCSSLSDLSPISQWNVSNVTTMESMFDECDSLKVADVSGWKLNANVNISKMFAWTALYSSSQNSYLVYSKKNILIISQDSKLQNYDYLSENIHPLAMTFDPAGGTFSDGNTGKKTVEHPQVISDASDATINGLLKTAVANVDEPSKTGYVFNTWQAGTLPTETNPAKVIYNKLTNTYTAQYDAWNITVPTTIDFGSHKLAVGEQTYSKPKLTGNALQVNDDRNHDWQVTAKLLSELTNQNGYQMTGVLRYQAGGAEQMFSTANAINIASGKGTKNLSKDWSETEGLMLKVDSSKHKAGKYTSTIEWTLTDAPTP